MENLDLTLKLGLPRSDPIDTIPTNAFLSLHSLHSQGMICDGENNENNCSKNVEGPHHNGAINNMNVNLMVSNFILKNFSGSPTCAASSNTSVDLLPNLTPTTLGNDYVLLDVPCRRTQRELANSSDPNPRGGGRPRAANFNDQNKRCTNYNCHTNDTPMWRKGPLGPKTLCNACGIKYRKEEEKKKAREAASRENGYRLPNGQVFFNFTD